MSGKGPQLSGFVDGLRKESGPAAEWFEACVGLLILGFFYQLIGTVMVRFLGFGGFLVTLGAVMVVFGVIGILLTPLAWAISVVAETVRRDKQASW